MLPCDVPDTGANENDVRFGSLPEVLQDALHVRRVDPGEEVETHQVVVGAVLSDLSVLSAVSHGTQSTSFHQYVLLKAKLSLNHRNKGMSGKHCILFLCDTGSFHT